MTNLQRFVEKRMNLMETSVMRFRLGKNFMTETDWMRLAESVQGLDYDVMCQIVDKNHAKFLESGNIDFMSAVEKRRQELRERGEIK